MNNFNKIIMMVMLVLVAGVSRSTSKTKGLPVFESNKFSTVIVQRIAASHKSSPEVLEKVAQDVIASKPQLGFQKYFYLMLQIVQAFASRPAEEQFAQKNHVLSEKFSRLALQDVEEMTVDVEIRFLLPLLTSTEASSPTWQKDRKEKVALSLHPIQRINLGINPNFNPEDRPDMSVQPPLSSGLRPGASPSRIQDAKLRKEYEDAIAKNDKKAKFYTEQTKLRRASVIYSPQIEEYVVQAYTTPPFNLPELKQLLDKYDIGAEREKRILDAVMAQMKYALEGATSLQSTPPPLPSMVPTPEPTPQAAPSATRAPKQ